MSSKTALLFPPFHIPANVDLLYRGQTIVSLERRAVQGLRCLAENHDRVVMKEELLEAVWPDTFTTNGVLKRAISQACRNAPSKRGAARSPGSMKFAISPKRTRLSAGRPSPGPATRRPANCTTCCCNPI